MVSHGVWQRRTPTLQARPEAGAKHERTLATAACTPM
jgi:hypothetical protein